MSTGHHCRITRTRPRNPLRSAGPFAAAAVMVVASCGGGSDSESADAPDAANVPDAADVIEDPAGAAEDIAESLEQLQSREGGGSARLVVGDQEWTFDSVLCAFGEEQIGQEGAEFNLSGIQDGLQVYASIDGFGHSLSLNDIEDFQNPSVSLDSFGDVIIELDGKHVAADAEFIDGTSDDLTPIAGTFEATCP